MTAAELKDVLVSFEFRRGLEELSSCLASIKQRRPIYYLLAKCLWKRGVEFELEYDLYDLFVNEKRIEFMFDYDLLGEILKQELSKCNDYEGMRAAVDKMEISHSWGVMPRIWGNICGKMPDIFVWIICSRDLSGVPVNSLKRIPSGRTQVAYNKVHPYKSNREFLDPVDRFLELLKAERPFSQERVEIATNGDFPSTYYFLIWDFSKTS